MWQRDDLPAVPLAGPAEPMVAVLVAEGAEEARREARTSPSPPATVPADTAGSSGSGAGAAAAEQQPERPRHPVRLTPSQERRMRQVSRNRFEQLAVAASMDVYLLKRRNEPQMLRSFWKQYAQPLLYKRYNELLEAQAFNEWLERRRICKEGEEYTDTVGRPTDTVNRRLPQLRYAPAESRRAPGRQGRGRGAEHTRVRRRGRHHVTKPWRGGDSSASECAPSFGQVLGYF